MTTPPDNRIRVVRILRQTAADGPGLRTSIYCAGCAHRCPGCHNPETWDFRAGEWMGIDALFELIVADSLSDVSFSGGDPFYQAPAFTRLARRIKTETDKTIWCWTGFTIEQLRTDPAKAELLQYVDVLVDGPFIESLKDSSLPFRGSSNQ